MIHAPWPGAVRHFILALLLACTGVVSAGDPPAEPGFSEKFVPSLARATTGATLEIRAEATVIGAEVKLKQLCRWTAADAPAFAQVADLVLVRLDERTPFRSISLDELKATLRDAGVHLGSIRFAGAVACTVSRSDVRLDEGEALRQWIEQRTEKTGTQIVPSSQDLAHGRDARATDASPGATQHSALSTQHSSPSTQHSPPATQPNRTLRELLLADLCVRLHLPADVVQMQFNPADEKVLNLSEPLFRFNVEARRVRNLGDVTWDVQIITDGGTRKTPIAAVARAWQNQLVVAKPLAYRQVIREEDVVDRRILADRLSDEPLLTRDQTVGQQAANDLKPGTVVVARMVQAVPLVKSGQLVTLSIGRGGVQITTVARAMEGGCYGQTIKVRNENSRDTFDVVVTGPQAVRMGGEPPEKKSVAVADAKGTTDEHR